MNKLDPSRWGINEWAAAMNDGWRITVTVRGRPVILRYLTNPRFTSNEEAKEHVRRRAQEGSKLHQRALAIITLGH